MEDSIANDNSRLSTLETLYSKNDHVLTAKYHKARVSIFQHDLSETLKISRNQNENFDQILKPNAKNIFGPIPVNKKNIPHNLILKLLI